MTTRTDVHGITRQVETTIVTCKCGDQQEVQLGSVCHRRKECVMCANNKLRMKRSRMKKFEVQ